MHWSTYTYKTYIPIPTHTYMYTCILTITKHIHTHIYTFIYYNSYVRVLEYVSACLRDCFAGVCA